MRGYRMIGEAGKKTDLLGAKLREPIALAVAVTVQRNTHLALSQWRGPGPVPTGDSGGIAIFSVEDAYAAVAELRRRGVRCENVIAVPGMVTYASFYDPDGNRLQIAGPPPRG